MVALTWPHCGAKSDEKMPHTACVFFLRWLESQKRNDDGSGTPYLEVRAASLLKVLICR